MKLSLTTQCPKQTGTDCKLMKTIPQHKYVYCQNEQCDFRISSKEFKETIGKRFQ